MLRHRLCQSLRFNVRVLFAACSQLALRLEDAEDERPTWQRAEDANGEGRRRPADVQFSWV